MMFPSRFIFLRMRNNFYRIGVNDIRDYWKSLLCIQGQNSDSGKSTVNKRTSPFETACPNIVQTYIFYCALSLTI